MWKYRGKQEVVRVDISKDFYIEATYEECQGIKTFEFWLGRINYGIKTNMFGFEWKGEKLRDALNEWKEDFTDPEYMASYCEELLDPNEVMVDGTFEIKCR